MNKSGQFSISSFMRQQMCYLGQQQVFEEAADSFLRLTGVDISASQIERVCHYYGDRLEKEQQQAIKNGCSAPGYADNKTYYAMVDGSMLLTREEKWKEIKLARLFDRKDHTDVSKGRHYITQSTYVAHLGNYRDFFKKVVLL